MSNILDQINISLLWRNIWIGKIEITNIEKARNFMIKEINQDDLMSKKHKKLCTTLNYIEHLLTLASASTGCVSMSAFASLFDILIGNAGSVEGLKNCTITSGIKNVMSIIKFMPKMHLRFTYNDYGPFKSKKKYKNLKE